MITKKDIADAINEGNFEEVSGKKKLLQDGFDELRAIDKVWELIHKHNPEILNP